MDTLSDTGDAPARLLIVEHSSSSYSPRTYLNAKTADITVALAVDYSTAGEKLTHKAAGDKYVALPLTGPTEDAVQAARLLFKALRDRGLKEPTINVAGNGIYTLDKQGWTQRSINLHLFIILAKVHRYWPIKRVISGGQTGVDMAGIVAGSALCIDSTATLPKGFLQRGVDKVDVQQSQASVLAQIEAGVEHLVELMAEALARDRKSAFARNVLSDSQAG